VAELSSKPRGQRRFHFVNVSRARAGHFTLVIIISVYPSSGLLIFVSGCFGASLPGMSELPLSEKVIVIIGGTTGLGLSAARACVDAGARGVVVTGRDPASAEAAVTAIGANVSAAHVGNAVEAGHAPAGIALAMERFGRFDALYHVAGGSGRRLGDGPLHDVTDEGLRGTLELNLHSVILSNRAAVRHFMAHRSSGAVLNMGSVLGWSPSPTYFGTHVYAAAKSAIVGFTKSVAAYYASHGIRFNVLAPALVETPMAKRAANDESILRFIATKQPLDGGRIGRPDDCDGAAVFLLSDAARFITGQVLAVDGGWTISEGQIPAATS
jgi:NAD(P)-dependent dehydrogenase (short-subunit alcohol dehydrogenase family)